MKKSTSGLKILFFGIILTFLGVFLTFIDDYIDGILRPIICKSGYAIFFFGFALGIYGMGKHWISFFKNIKK